VYRISEVFYSIQGEGRFAGEATVFVRFAGCNLNCSWCDTPQKNKVQHEVNDPLGVVILANNVLPENGARRVTFTGGEPLLQLDDRLVREFAQMGWVIYAETNGTVPFRPHPMSKVYLTCSPKPGHPVIGREYDAVKIVMDEGVIPEQYAHLSAYLYVQPCDYGQGSSVATKNEMSRRRAVEFVLGHQHWKLSLQTHKILGIL